MAQSQRRPSFLKPDPRVYVLPLLAIALLGAVLYGHTLQAPFYMDDLINIRNNLYTMKALSLPELFQCASRSYAHNRPLANISFGLNYFVHGYELSGYHLVNIVVHIINGMLLFVFVFKTITLGSQRDPGPHPAWIATLASLLWFVNPIQIQSVTYIVQRMTSMASLFFLSAFLCYLYGRVTQKPLIRIALFALCALCWTLCMASKEIALTLPGLIFVYEWFFFQDLDKTWLRRSAIYLAAGLLALVAFVYWVYDYNPLELLTAIHPTRLYTPFERFLTEGRVIFLYMSLLFFPHPSRLTVNHDVAVSVDLIHPWTTWASMAGLIGLLVITVLMAKRYRLFAFCAVWFFANLAIEALAASIEPMFEHRAYLPSMLLFLPVVCVAFKGLKRPRIAVPPLAAVILIFSLWTYERNTLWNDPIAFWEDAVQKSPNHYRPYFNLGTAYLHAQSYDPAILSLKKALTLRSPYPTEILTNMGALYLETGQYDLARDTLTRAIGLNAKNHMAHVLLGNLSQKEEDYPSAVRQYQAAVRINGDFAESYYNLGIVYMDMGDTAKSVEAFGRAARLRPMWSQAHSSLGLALARQGRYDSALLSLEEAVSIEAGNQEALFNLAKVYSLGGDHERAAETYESLLEINPEDVEAIHNLAVIYLNHLRDAEQAAFYFKKALAANPQYAHAAAAQNILAQITLKP